MTLIDLIIQEYETDDFNHAKASAFLKRTYQQGDASQKEAINHTLIAICGFSMPSLLANLPNRAGEV